MGRRNRKRIWIWERKGIVKSGRGGKVIYYWFWRRERNRNGICEGKYLGSEKEEIYEVVWEKCRKDGEKFKI